nr:DUF3472 domain-containing protein [Roseateles oligotrophus]
MHDFQFRLQLKRLAWGLTLSGSLCLLSISGAQAAPAAAAAVTKATAPVVALSGNAFITRAGADAPEWIDDARGLMDWSDPQTVISSYVRVAQAGKFNITLRGSPPPGSISDVKVTALGKSFTIRMNSGAKQFSSLATVDVAAPGYVRIDVQGINRTGPQFGTLSDIVLNGTATPGLVFANDPSNFYWSRRGPSVHLGFNVPANTEYFYSELTVPQGEDALGSYFMSNGNSESYMGIQVVAPDERWVLFSVWDPATGATRLLSKGPNVIVNNFGGEGTGGQSHLVYPWVAGNTYKFITRVRPDGLGATNYSAWFFAPEDGRWHFIATWHRENTTTWMKGVYSFVENFNVDKGYLGRRALFGQQWAVSSSGVWTELNKAWYDTDPTGDNKQRLDFAGGLDAGSGQFFLRMGGFFNETVPARQNFIRPLTGRRPALDLNTLP